LEKLWISREKLPPASWGLVLCNSSHYSTRHRAPQHGPKALVANELADCIRAHQKPDFAESKLYP